MYLNNIIIENMGAIENCRLLEKDLIREDNTPRIIVLVGQNGSGKTTLLSSIVDSLYEFANDIFEDILPRQGTGYKYFKILGHTNQRINTNHGFNYLQFKHDTNLYEYMEKYGDLDSIDAKFKTNNLLTNGLIANSKWSNSDNLKIHTSVKNNNEIKDYFEHNSIGYFPSDRFEYPYWMVQETINHLDQLQEVKKFSNSLDKDIVIRRSLNEVKSWILDIFLDSKVDLSDIGKLINDKDDPNATFKLSLANASLTTRSNIEEILSYIVQQEVILDLNIRIVFHGSRLCLRDKKTNIEILPSLNNLSAGQSTLLSIFGNILKQSDQNNFTERNQLSDIEGIILIDEIDLHLHIDLQKDVLPKLIKLFPKIQFIVTTHSPFFLNGIEMEFDKDDYRIVNVASGNFIEYDQFEEFDKAFEVFEDLTNNYRNQINFLQQKIEESTKPLIITEGKTDWKHLKKALEKFKTNGLYTNLDIEFLEYENEISMGEIVLDTIFNSYSKIPQSRKTIFLFDRDGKSSKKHINEEYQNPIYNVYSFCIPRLSEELDKICIEFYYLENELKTEDENGRRLFLGNEFFSSTNSKCGNFQTEERNSCDKLSIIDQKVFHKDDLSHSNSIALTKNDFAENILNEKDNFTNFNIDNFKKIFDVIEKIV